MPPSRLFVPTDPAAPTERRTLHVGDLAVDVARKDIKHVHLSVYPPDGRVRLAVPLHIDDEAARLAVVDRLAWIRRQQRALARQPRQPEREMVSRESHYVWGQRCLLEVVLHTGAARVEHTGPRTLTLYVRPDADTDRRRRVLTEWYRAQVKARVPGLVAAWAPRLDVEVADWGVKQMKTKWGSCNTEARRIWVNVELAKKPPACLEYIVVHEMVHLLERHHTDRFRALMDRHLPRWRHVRATLNAAPLAHEDWTY
jgi:predicted metal-dependent hydrolase